ncbi:Importin_beta-3 subunit [Hexamita inflata]|uniref:Importin beta-3 subunit n=1 Tax=Hexamita inflata TaxID=28002 RepID=A0AA86TW58_9EUKA|nr:Importin beta-3 subunit [Hexamita inflata]
MNAEQFHNILMIIKDSKDSNEIYQAETAYKAFREITPSDNFLQLLINEIVTKSEVQTHAIVLLRQDMDKNGTNSAIYRLSEYQIGRQIMIQLLMYLAENPNSILVQAIAIYIQSELQEKRLFQEAFQFVMQGIDSQNTEVRECVTTLIQILSNVANEKLVEYQFDFLGFLNKAIEDTSDKVAFQAIKSLSMMIVQGFDLDGKSAFPPEVTGQITLAILNRISKSIQAASIDMSIKMLSAFKDAIEVEGESFIFQFNEIMTFLEQIMASDLDENLKKVAVQIFSELTEHCLQIKKMQRERIQSFMAKYIIPNLVPTEVQIQTWMESEKDFEFADNSIQEFCMECIGSSAYILGKQIVAPLIHDVIQQALQSSQWQVVIAAIIAMATGGQGMEDVINQKEVKYYTEALVKFSQHTHPKVRYEVLAALTVLSTTFATKITKYHAQIFPMLFRLHNDPVKKVAVHASTAMINFVSKLDYEETYMYLENVKEMIELCWGGNMVQQANALSLLNSLCEIVDEEDLTPLLYKFMPNVFEQFVGTMNAITSQGEFSQEENLYITSIVQLIAQAASAVTELFNDQIDQIMKNLCLIAQRSLAQTEHEIFGQTMDSMMQLADHFAGKMESYVQQLWPTFAELLQKDIYEVLSDVKHEGQTVTNDHVVAQQQAVLSFVATFCEQNPNGLKPVFDQIYQILSNKVCVGSQMAITVLLCQAELLNMSDEPIAVHNQIFRHFIDQIYPGAENLEKTVTITDLDEAHDAAQCLSCYIRHYLRAHLKHNDPNFQETAGKFFEVLSFLHAKTMELFKIQMEDVGECEEQEEKDAETEQLYDVFTDAIEAIGEAYGQFMLEFKQNIPFDLLEKFVVVASQLFAAGVESTPGISVSIVGYKMFSDIAEYMDAQVTQTVFANILDPLINYLKCKDHRIVQCTYYLLYMYVKRTLDPVIANNADILNQAIQLMNELKEDGSETALNAYDNICSYLCVSGLIAKQTVAFWGPLMDYLSQMESDSNEIEHVLYFLVEQSSSSELIQIKEQVCQVIVNLFFGKCYSHIKKHNQEIMQQIRPYLQQCGQIAQKAVTNGSDFVKKNWANFW